jgi:putative FmdB family regulatory protein
MPIYEYRCKACGSKFEKLVSLSTKIKDIECPECGQHKAEKEVSLFGGISGASSSGGASLSSASCGPSS